MQAVFPISGATVLVLGAEAGLLLPWSSRGLAAAGRSHISERFYLGGVGAGALRGFAQKGVGPMDARRPAAGGGEVSPRQAVRFIRELLIYYTAGGWQAITSVPPLLQASPRPGRQLDALGGDAFVSILAALRFRLPSQALDQSGVHGQTFLNGGSLVAVSNSLPSSLHQLATTLRWSVVSACAGWHDSTMQPTRPCLDSVYSVANMLACRAPASCGQRSSVGSS